MAGTGLTPAPPPSATNSISSCSSCEASPEASDRYGSGRSALRDAGRLTSPLDDAGLGGCLPVPSDRLTRGGVTRPPLTTTRFT